MVEPVRDLFLARIEWLLVDPNGRLDVAAAPLANG